MKQFSYANIYSAYLSAVLFTFCCTAVLYARDHSKDKPLGVSFFSECAPRKPFSPNCREIKNIARPVFDKETEKIIAGCSSNDTPCDQNIIFRSPITITQSGRYCLAADIDIINPFDGPAITIAPNVTNVVIDLNNHVVSSIANSPAIDVLDGAMDITIINGVVKPLGCATTGLRIQNGSGVVLNGLLLEGNNDINNTQRGILFSGVTGFRINNCSVNQVGFIPFELNNCSVGNVTYCSLLNNFTDISDDDGLGIVEIANCRSVLFEQVSVDLSSAPYTSVNASKGFSVSNQSSGITFLHCFCNASLVRRFGFAFFDSTDCVCRECVADGNARFLRNPLEVVAFIAQRSSRITWDSCIAGINVSEGNFSGTSGPGCRGFALRLSKECCVLNCQALFNDARISEGVGFEVTGPDNDNNYLRNNIGLTNNTNFIGDGQSTNNVFFGNLGNFARGFNRVNFENIPFVDLDVFLNTFTPVTNPPVWSNISGFTQG